MLEHIIKGTHRAICNLAGCEFVSLDRIQGMVDNLTEQIQADSTIIPPKAVIGIHRAGTYPAALLAQNLDLPLHIIDITSGRATLFGVPRGDYMLIQKYLREHKGPTLMRPFEDIITAESAILMDDDCGSGKTFNVAKQEIAVRNPKLTLYETVLCARPGRYQPHFAAEHAKTLLFNKLYNVRFPWQSYSPHHKEYLVRMAKTTRALGLVDTPSSSVSGRTNTVSTVHST